MLFELSVRVDTEDLHGALARCLACVRLAAASLENLRMVREAETCRVDLGLAAFSDDDAARLAARLAGIPGIVSVERFAHGVPAGPTAAEEAYT